MSRDPRAGIAGGQHIRVGGALTVTMLAGLLAASALAQQRPVPCSPEVMRWGERCTDRHLRAFDRSARATVLSCPQGRAIIVLQAGAAGILRVEAVVGAQQSFRRAGAIGYTPMGNFHGWDSIAAPLRAAFDKLIECATETPLPIGETTAAPIGTPPPPPAAKLPDQTPLPWLLIAALFAAIASSWTRPHKRLLARNMLAGRLGLCLGLMALGAISIVARWALIPWHYLHQNGQGPLWTQYALCGQSPYGPGYHELLAALTRPWPDSPEGAVLALQALLAGVATACVFWLARGVGARPALAWAATLFVAAEPMMTREWRSESYFGFQLSLLFIAAACLATQARAARWKSRSFAFAVLAAGLVVAAIARIHPIGWVASAALPVVLLGGRGSVPARLRRALIAGVGIAAVTALGAGEVIWDTLHGELGAKWGPGAEQGFGLGHDALVALGWAAAAGAALALLARRRSHALLLVVACLSVAAAGIAADVLGQSAEWINAASERLYAPTLLALTVALLSLLPRNRWQSWVVAGTAAIAGVLAILSVRPLAATYPTDAVEQRWLISQRALLPPNATVVYVSRAQSHVFVFPAHGTCDPSDWRAALDDLNTVDLHRLPAPRFYYRSSLCSTAAGRPQCDAVERAFALEPIAENALPALRSLHHLPYDRETVHVGLYRMKDRSPQ